MAISQSRYVLITSGVGGAAAAGRRELIARLMTTNTKAPTKGVLEFGGGAAAALKNVAEHFGSTSAEYAFAAKYFGWVSKDARQADKISFGRYTPTATAPQLISTNETPALSTFTNITSGSLKISMGGVSYELTGLDFSAVTSFADVATIIQTALQANTAGGALWTTATVSYSNGSFVLTGGTTGTAEIVPATNAESGTAIKDLVGWSLSANPVVSVGCAAETLTEALNRIANT